MTGPEPVTPATQPPPDNLTARVFRALYQDFDLHTVAGIHIAVPKGTPCFTASQPRRDRPTDQRPRASRPAAPSPGSPPEYG